MFFLSGSYGLLFFEIENIDVSLLNRFFQSRDKILATAKGFQFVKRIRELDPFDFFTSITFGALKSNTVTLNSLADELPCHLSRMGIHRRFTELEKQAPL